jgi:hypothetical protein
MQGELIITQMVVMKGEKIMNELTTKLGIVRKATALLLLAVGAVLLALAVMVSTPQPAQALCLAEPEEGKWINTDPNAQKAIGSLTRIEIHFACPDVIVNGQPTDDEPAYARVFSKCNPADCDWGKSVFTPKYRYCTFLPP